LATGQFFPACMDAKDVGGRVRLGSSFVDP
jgi:hypothetical protein